MTNATPVGFFKACFEGDVDVLRALLANDPNLVRARTDDVSGSTGLHLAAGAGHLDAVRLLLERGADPNTRDVGDNIYPLHLAAANRHVEVVRGLLDAGGDVHGFGDVHNGDTIGWAAAAGNEAVLQLLIERGARHHVFSAMALRDLDLVRRVVQDNPHALARRRSRFENEHTPVHAALVAPDGLGGLGGDVPNYPMLELLIALGADVNAADDKGRTPLAIAMLRGDRQAMQLLKAAGAAEPSAVASPDFTERMTGLANSIKKGAPMIHVVDVAATLDWYVSIGFKELGRYADGDDVNLGMVALGEAELMIVPGGKRGEHRGDRDVSLWFYTDDVEAIYQTLKSRQMESARAWLAGEPAGHAGITFEQDIYNPFYGGREFCIRDPNGYGLYVRSDTIAPA